MRRDIALSMARRVSDQDIIFDYRMTARFSLFATLYALSPGYAEKWTRDKVQR
jgi:hypothetical protein